MRSRGGQIDLVGMTENLGLHRYLQLLIEFVRRQSRDKSVPERLLMEAEVVLLWRDGGQP